MIYDIIVVGAGPAGLTAAIYGARRKASVLVFEGEAIGGQAIKAYVVKNYPGIPSISGLNLVEKMREQVEELGVKIRLERVVDVEKAKGLFRVRTEKGECKSRTVILATGLAARKLGFEGEDAFLGKGVSYCTICDGPLFKGKTVAVVGGGDSAVKDALFLASYAKKVFLIHRRDELRAEPYLQDELFANEKIEVLLERMVKAVKGKKFVESVVLANTKTGEVEEVKVDGVFIEVGGIPASVLAGKLKVEIDERGYIKVDKDQRTNVEGLFAAGDVTDFPLKQIVTATAQGATAAISACKYIGKGFARYDFEKE